MPKKLTQKEELYRHAAIVEKWIELDYCKLDTVAIYLQEPIIMVQSAISRYLRKGVSETCTLKSNV